MASEQSSDDNSTLNAANLTTTNLSKVTDDHGLVSPNLENAKETSQKVSHK